MPLTMGVSISRLPAKVGLQAVIVPLGDRVELVVVAAGTADGDAQKGGTGGVGPIGQALVPQLASVHVRFVDLRAEGVKAGADAGFEMPHLGRRHDVAAVHRQVVWPQFVAGDLFLHENAS